MSVMNKAGATLTAVFLVSVVALVAEILYVLFRRRASLSLRSTQSGKQLLRLFCRRGAQVEPDAGATAFPADQDDDEDGEAAVMKWRRGLILHGPSRVLFTIKEEEKEEELMEDAASHRLDQSHESVDNFPLQRTPSDIFIVEVGGDKLGDATPFSTPCASPPYYTPSPSPSRTLEDAVY